MTGMQACDLAVEADAARYWQNPNCAPTFGCASHIFSVRPPARAAQLNRGALGSATVLRASPEAGRPDRLRPRPSGRLHICALPARHISAGSRAAVAGADTYSIT